MKIFIYTTLVFFAIFANAQKEETDAMLFGDVKSDGEHIPFANIVIKGTTIGTSADATGHFMLTNLPLGKITVVASAIGYKLQEKTVVMEKGKTTELYFDLKPDYIMTEQVVVSADRNKISRKDAPVVVTAISPKKLNAVDATNLAQGVNFTPGLRVETDCQNCGFTQLRMNGLDGAYSQILIDSRPVFSGLAGVYGLEQIPASMIERIEVVRGGGSALFGGNAIAGTVNIITKDPIVNNFSVGTDYSITGIGVNNTTPAEGIGINFNTSVVSDDLKSGLFVFGVNKKRDAWDYNGDGFTELTKIENTSLGFRAFYRPKSNNRIGVEYHSINEYRRGGNKLDMLPHIADITEMVDVKMNGGSLSYETFLFGESRNKLSVYASAQDLKRDSYYGANQDPNAYGFTHGFTSNAGIQYVSEIGNAIFAPSKLTAGLEHTFDKIKDTKLGSVGVENSLVANQNLNTIGMFAQNNWQTEKIALLLGVRYDIVNIKDRQAEQNNYSNSIINPRANFLYKLTKDIQLRLSASTGYRAPQIFDEDLHIETSGARRVIHRNADDLKMERSISYSASVDIDKYFGKVQTEFLIEGFYTRINDAFVNEYQVNDSNSTVVSLRKNATGNSVVSGVNFEINVAPSKEFYFQFGGTAQISKYSTAYQWGEDSLSVSDKMLRTPNTYGYVILSYDSDKRFKASVSGNYTGSMLVPHLAGGKDANGDIIDKEELVKTKNFFDAGVKISYKVPLSKTVNLELSTGVKNIFNSYQNDFDYGVNRDAGYIYGPAKPRLIFFGVTLKNS